MMLDDYAHTMKSLSLYFSIQPPLPSFATNEELFNEFYRENFLLMMMNLLIYGRMATELGLTMY